MVLRAKKPSKIAIMQDSRWSRMHLEKLGNEVNPLETKDPPSDSSTGDSYWTYLPHTKGEQRV